MIIIGNLDTLCDEKAHRKNDKTLSIEPTEVFNKLREIRDRTAEKTSLDVLMQEFSNGHLHIGDVFGHCSWNWDDLQQKTIYVNIEINDKIHTFKMKVNRIFENYGAIMIQSKLNLLVFNEKGRAMFEYVSEVDICDMVEDNVCSHVKAKMIEWIDDESKDEALLSLKMVPNYP